MALSTDITPDAGVGNSEGIIKSPQTSFAAFATARAGTNLAITNPTGEFAYFTGESAGNVNLSNYFFKIDYTSLPANATITSLIWNFKARFGSDNSDNRESMDMCLGTQSATLVTGDWNSYTTHYGNWDDSIASYGSSVFRTQTLNAAAISAITPGTSIIKYCWLGKDNYDNAVSLHNARPIFHTASATSSADRPYMTVEYTLPGGGNPMFFGNGVTVG